MLGGETLDERRSIVIALGSWWALLVIIAMTPALIWKLFDEEKFLARNLPGYVAHWKKVLYRLIPQVWWPGWVAATGQFDL
jgi:protein-S-isoprenylcysteine O-methyltransferase Ste14